MNLMRPIILSAAAAATFALGVVFQQSGAIHMFAKVKTTYLKLTEPLVLTAGGADYKYHYLLPAGTAMYEHHSFPEGHTTYIVYVNFKGAFAHEVVQSDKVNLVDPIWAHTIEKDEVQKLMAETPISKDDLVRILKARKITREELAQIVRDWHE